MYIVYLLILIAILISIKADHDVNAVLTCANDAVHRADIAVARAEVAIARANSVITKSHHSN